MIFKTKLVGIKFSNPKENPVEGDIVHLVLEKDNKFDCNAIKVINNDNEKIGYIATNKTIYDGNRAKGYIDNQELIASIDIENDSYEAIITKMRPEVGFIDIITQ